MSGQPPPQGGDPGQAAGIPGLGGQGEQPSEEEIQEYVSQMRGAPLEQIVAEVLQALLNSAQMKLGRRDGRLLIDLAGTVTEQTREHLSEQVLQQVDEGLSKLRMAQVEAEEELQEAREQGEEVSEPNDLDSVPPDPTAERAEEQAGESGGGQPPSGSGGASGLWTPG